EPAFGLDIDYFGRNTQDPIEIEMVFLMQASERDQLVKEIVQDAPQMKNAAEALDASLNIVVTVRTLKAPMRAVFVSDLSLRNSAKPPDKSLRLLSVPYEAAVELLSKTMGSNRGMRQANQIEEYASRFDSDDWPQIKEAATEGQP